MCVHAVHGFDGDVQMVLVRSGFVKRGFCSGLRGYGGL